VSGRVHQSRQGRRVPCSQVDGMQASSVVGVCFAERQKGRREPRHQQRGVYTTCMPFTTVASHGSDCSAHSNGQRQCLTHLPDTRIKSQARQGRASVSTTSRAILRASRTLKTPLEPQLCIDLQARCCLQLARVVNRALLWHPLTLDASTRSRYPSLSYRTAAHRHLPFLPHSLPPSHSHSLDTISFSTTSQPQHFLLSSITFDTYPTSLTRHTTPYASPTTSPPPRHRHRTQPLAKRFVVG